jgi:hypothetical protein
MTGRAFFKPTRIPGGCLDCNAYRTLDSSDAPLIRVVVHHDPTCPALDALDRDATEKED